MLKDVEVTGVRVRPPDQYMVFIREREGDRAMVIAVNVVDAEAIQSYYQGSSPPFPYSHNLIFEILSTFGVQFAYVTGDKVEADHILMNIILYDSNRRIHKVPAAPGTAIALALRAHAPIFIEEKILAQYKLASPLKSTEAVAEPDPLGKPPTPEELKNLRPFYDALGDIDLDLGEPDSPKK